MKIISNQIYKGLELNVVLSEGNCKGCHFKSTHCDELQRNRVIVECSKYKRLDGLNIKFVLPQEEINEIKQ